MNSQLNITVDPTEEGIRLDKFLFSKEVLTSRSQIARLIDEGCVLVNKLQAKASLKTKSGDVIHVTLPEAKNSELLSEDIKLNILHEDKDLLFINKDANMVVHPGAGHHSGTLTNALLHHCGKLSKIGGEYRPGIVHRLDKGTSGVMVIAKNDKIHQALSDAFKNHDLKKTYKALVFGRMKEKEGEIKTYIKRSEANRKKYTTHVSVGKIAITRYKVAKEYKYFSLLDVEILTGRTHQIRVHLTSLGHGIVGDALYGNSSKRLLQIVDVKERDLFKNLDHTLLHAYSLKLKHPGTKKVMDIKAELPEDFKKIAGKLTPCGK